MAFNWQTFKTRTLTAAVFVAVMLTGLLWNQWSFLILFSIIHFGCWWEYLKLVERIHKINFHPYLKMGLMVMGYGIVLFSCDYTFNFFNYDLSSSLSLPVSVAGFALIITGIFLQKVITIKSFVLSSLGILYISFPIGFMIGFHGIESGIPIIYTESNLYLFYFPIFIIGCLWINDTGAYILGSLFGKTPLSKISPKKTWEGTISGIILSAATMGSLSLIVPKKYSFNQSFLWWIILALIVVISGTFGDLLESKLKRMAGVKDSGAIMPGHGGFLDRFDSLLLATPFVWIYVMLFLK